MILEIKKSKLKGELSARPSKSFAHRYLFSSMLSENECVISNVDFSDDIVATLDSIHAYGKKHYRDFENNKVSFYKGFNKNFDPTFDSKESGTTLRIMLPIALTLYDRATFIGSGRLIERGIGIYEDIFKYISFDKDKYSIKTKGLLSPGLYKLPGNISSQYISGLLYSLPLLDDDSEIILTTKLESKNYVLMTLDVLKKYNIDITTNIYDSTNNTPIYFKIKGNQKYISFDTEIEGDYSNAAFIDAFNYFGNDIKINGLNKDSLQSDKIYKTYFDKLDNEFTEIDISNCIDLGPILITFASLKHGARFINTERLKIKESDRGNAIASELRKCNAKIDVFDNEIIVNKSDLKMPIENLNSHNDHRIAMSLTLLSTLFDINLEDYLCVKKSYPSFFEDLKTLGLQYN